MNFYEMIMSNFEPISLRTGYYIRKRIFHKGYEVLTYNKITNIYIHVQYIEDLK